MWGSPAQAQNELSGVAKDIYAALNAPAAKNTLDVASLNALYAARDYKPLWQTKEHAAMVAFVDAMTDFVVAHGLEEVDHPIAEIKSLLEAKKEADAPRLELLVTDWLIRLKKDLQGNRAQLAQLYVGWAFTSGLNGGAQELIAAVAEDRVVAYLTSLTPREGDYPLLADALLTYREIKAKGGWPAVPVGPTLKQDMRDPRIVMVKARLTAEGYWSGDSDEHYSQALKEAVIAYQQRNGLEADGNIGRQSLAALNISVERRIDQIKANMERLRHMPRIFPPRRAVVNIAAASIQVFDDNNQIYTAPVITGRTDRKTPFIQSELRSIIFNPSWHVPAKIAREDILPKLRKDPHYLEKMGFVVRRLDGDEDGPVDWSQITATEFAFRLRQSPGELNSLGRIKFDFDNDFAVYMHGTPHEELFAKANRHLSSGCIRLHEPELFAVMTLRDNEGEWTLEKVQAEIDRGKTRWMKVANPLPLFVIYQTAFFPAPDTPIHFRPDDYNYDAILMNAVRSKMWR